MNEMPRVGAKIRVARTYAGGTVIAIEGIVVAFDLDKFERVTCIHLADGMSVSLKNDTKSTVTWVELEPPKSALLPEPDDGTIWLRPGTEERIDQVFLRADRAGTGWGAQDRWFGTASRQQSRERLDIREGDELIRLVPAPDLADMVILWRSDAAAYCDRVHGSGFDKCGNSVCADRRALMTKYETGATA